MNPDGTSVLTETAILANGNLTTWTYDPSGVLLSKRDAADQQVNYTYDVAGRVLTRTWARGVVTTYGYTAGQLTSVQYTNDPTNTPTVSIAYDRLGRITDQSNDRSTTDYDYDPATLRLIREETTIDPDGAAGPLPSLTRVIDRSRDNLQRPTGFVLGNEHAVGYGYDVSGRLATISAQGLPNLPGKAHAFEYLYAPGSSLISKVTGPVHEVDNTYETHRNVLSEKKNTRTVGTPGELSVIGYTVNEIGQRVQRNLRGEIRAEFYSGLSNDPYATNWTYDALGQVTNEDKPAAAADRGYSYDLIGNRKTSTSDGVTTTYSANSLNQYQEISVPSVQSVVPVHDPDGNMTTGLLNGSGNGQFEYDGANQLILTQSTATSDPTKYAYDAFGRRIAKITYPNGSAVASAATVFLYDGWNLIAEYKLDAGAWILDHTYTWGLDLSGSTQGSGGVGGLLSVTKHEAPPTASGQASTTHFYPIYDGNGNIEAYLDSNGQLATIFQYGAFGNVLSGGGKGAAIEQAKFSHRFSTKCRDAETGLVYYGRRYYHTVLGRWVNRDPIAENGGVNLYGFVGNNGLDRVDYLGLRYPGPGEDGGPEDWEGIRDYHPTKGVNGRKERPKFNRDVFSQYEWKFNRNEVTAHYCGCDPAAVEQAVKIALMTFQKMNYPGLAVTPSLDGNGVGTVGFTPTLVGGDWLLGLFGELGGGVGSVHYVSAFGPKSGTGIDQRVITNAWHALVGVRMWGHASFGPDAEGYRSLRVWTMAWETWNNLGGWAGAEDKLNAVAEPLWNKYLLDTLYGVLLDQNCSDIAFEEPVSDYSRLDLFTRFVQDDFFNPFLILLPEAK
jgi:RHS repeat-associated protein